MQISVVVYLNYNLLDELPVFPSLQSLQMTRNNAVNVMLLELQGTTRDT
jgi:hypothetical protein